MIYKYAMLGSIVSAIVLIPGLLVALLRNFYPNDLLIPDIAIIAKTIWIAALIPVLIAYLKIANYNKSENFEIATWFFFIILTFIVIFSHTIIQNLNKWGFLVFSLIGILSIYMGIAIFKLKNEIDEIKGVAIWHVINGAIVMTVYLFPLITISGIILNLIEARFFYIKDKKGRN